MCRLVILGPDGCGKDTLARLIRDLSSLRFARPTSRIWAEHIPEWQDGRDIDWWWQQRRDHRDEWIEAANQLKARNGVTAIADRVFGEADMYVGLRHQDELSEVLQRCNVDMVVWCWNPALRHNHGTTLTPELSADMSWGLGVQWRLAQPHLCGARRIVTMLNLPESTRIQFPPESRRQ